MTGLKPAKVDELAAQHNLPGCLVALSSAVQDEIMPLELFFKE